MIHTSVKEFNFSKKDLLTARTGTDGFQPKFFTKDRRHFVKAQAVISGVCMQDWLVEVIASDFCRQLHIPCVEQHPCVIKFAGRTFHGVYAKNFELDGFTFQSFESLISRHNLSTKEAYFIKMQTADKMKWCALKLSEYGKLAYDDCLKYILDLAIIDCLVGNVDRHTRNFGLFYHRDAGFCIPFVFDSGMGLFEHDYYRDHYRTFEDAMMNVYVSPYGEDPFEMADLLKQEFDLSAYDFQNLILPADVPGPYSMQYLTKIRNRFLEE